ncbi:porin [Bartonella sp. WD16.2]|uniref:porin n=1 Tax=Bartonella sp. WD16.2 TaxID=1933904 RepID=UPI00099AB0BC|nr:porin [Bartonella sp. WD16.2]AQX19434.1 Porin subfamily protein [Bartonella sp. WD16.2]
MNSKALLLGSAVVLAEISSAQADSTITAESKPIEYVRVCDAYGPGYFYIPGTETCIRLSGYVRADFKSGEKIDAKTNADLNNDQKTYRVASRLTLIFQTASETELGTLRSRAEIRSEWNSGKDKSGGQLRSAYIELGGFRIGLDDTIFNHWTGFYGNVINDDLIAPAGNTRTNVISYTFNSSTGFSAIIGAESGNASGPSPLNSYYYVDKNGSITDVIDAPSKHIKGYTPHILLGMKFFQEWGGVSTVAAYDAYYKKWAGKMRVDFNVNDYLNLWVMGGYKNNLDYYTASDDNTLSRENTTIYANWGGKWAAWTGATYKITPKANLNAQISYSAAKTLSTSVNIAYTLVPGFTITPELTYVSWNDNRSFTDKSTSERSYTAALNGKNALQAMIRFQRSF